MQPLTRFLKDPNATTDWTLDWSAWLNSTVTGDTIASVLWTVQAGLTKTQQTNTTTTATVWLSGGVLRKVYTITCQITTASGRTELNSFELLIQSK